jgi:hypothetical protein
VVLEALKNGRQLGDGEKIFGRLKMEKGFFDCHSINKRKINVFL